MTRASSTPVLLELTLTGWYIPNVYPMVAPVSRTTLFQSNRTQAVRLPKDVAFPEGVRAVEVLREGKRRVIVPADSVWDDFFDRPGIDLPLREQPTTQSREPF
jgi:antitoxin VapB